MAQRNSSSLVVVLVLLGALGGVLFYSINKLSADIAPGVAGAAPGTPEIAAGSIHEAAERGDLTGIERELARGVSVDQPMESSELWRSGMTPLMGAAFAGKSEAVARLIQAQAKTEARSRDGKTALMFAAGWADAATVKALLDAGARVDARTDEGLTAVMLAAARGSNEALKAVVDAGANVNTVNKWGETPLILAARAGDIDKTRFLLNAGASVDLKDNTGMTALNTAASGEGANDVVAALIEAKADVNAADNDGTTALMRAADRGNAEQVKMLLAAGADATKKDKRGWTAAQWAEARDDETGNAVADLLKGK